MLSTSHQFLFVHIPKTGGTSVSLAIRDFCDDQIHYIRGVDSIDPRGVAPKHANMAAYRSIIDERLWKHLFKFTVIRNPWDRAISYYFYTFKKSFRKPLFLENLPLPSTDFVNFIELDFVLRFEQLEKDYRELCRRIGLPAARKFPRVNRTSHKHYSAYYDKESREAVANRFAREIAEFGYTF